MGACNRSGEISDTPTSGTMKISVDESFAPIIDSHVYTFQKLYKYAKVNAAYKPEGEVMKDLLQDSARLVIVARQLTPTEMQVFEKIKITPRVTKVAIDGVALIVHPENTDTLLAIPQLKDIFTGKTTSWKKINAKSALDDITIVFDNSNSSTARYVIDSINQKQPLPAKAFAAKSNPELVDYVANNRNAIGVIGVNWISDFDDSTAIGFLKKIKVVAVGRNINPAAPDTYYQPFQGYLAEGTYPLRRNLYIISREARAGLGTGFASFVAGDKGQRIFLKSGLVPATMPIRLVNIRE
ncbi:phosphate ABC transporter substrate-binding protein [Adhaeribacter aerolatus]|uniref:Phosphate ABC transporter substrate-binding protein n=2 Tax=Adhaeribacter aerolatus TaxID=670289 RepID=A0A512ATV2_9BACT|nr:phosphate ABC transporter substrate-binding protein [Adhaeribacter aerolatus]